MLIWLVGFVVTRQVHPTMSSSVHSSTRANLSLVSFNCMGFNNGMSYIPALLDSFDVILLQEHWLSVSELGKLTFDGFISSAISGFDDSKLLNGRPFGGCAILYRDSLLGSIRQVRTSSRRFCAITIDYCGCTCLLVNVYLPTDYRSHAATQKLKDVLGEIAGFISTIAHDSLVIAGDWNADLARPGQFSEAVSVFLRELNLSLVDLNFPDNVGFTYMGHDGSKSWIDHVAVSAGFCSNVVSVHSLRDGRNLSDHNPLAFSLTIPAPVVPTPRDIQKGPSVQWHMATSDDIHHYQQAVQQSLETLSCLVSDEVLCCCDPSCSVHQHQLEWVCTRLVSQLRASAESCIPSGSAGHRRRRPAVAGWSQFVKPELEASQWWYKLWLEAGSPCAGVLFQLKKLAHRRYKYAVRRVKRKQEHIKRAKLAEALLKDPTRDFWSEVRHSSGSSRSSSAPVIDGISGPESIAALWNRNFKKLYNSSDGIASAELLKALDGEVLAEDIEMLSMSPDTIKQAIGKLKRGKSDGGALVSDHIIEAPPSLSSFLAKLFTALLRHGFMPAAFRDAIIQPIPKGSKDPSLSSNYRGIALASSLSKVFEWAILLTWNGFFSTSDLQFGFKPSYSTTLCSGVLKAVVNRYLNRGSKVYACLIDASKAFDTVNHYVLFKKLLDRNMPKPLVRFLLRWYRTQQLSIRWLGRLSDHFEVTNGVRQGGVLSPVLFAIYLDSLLESLRSCSRGCYWDSHFCGALCYADDLTILAPSPDSLRKMLAHCEAYADSHGLHFNVAKTQLICFRRSPALGQPRFLFCGQPLPLLDSVLHLGNTLHFNLSDKHDIQKKTMAFLRQANFVLFRFQFCDPLVKMKLFQAYCLALYGCSLWQLDCPELHGLGVSFNNVIRKIWGLPRNSHTSIVHCLGFTGSIQNLIFARFSRLLSTASAHPSALIRSIFTTSAFSCNSNFIGYNYMCGHSHCKSYNAEHFDISQLVREVRSQKFCIPGFSDDELNFFVATLSTM